MIRFAENLNKMITAGLGGAMEAPSTEVAVGHRVCYMNASGAVATFETNAAAPIRSLRVDMQPIQAGSGDPSPDNVRPITGRTEVTVVRTGKNLLNPDVITVGAFVRATSTSEENLLGSLTIHSSWNCSDYIPVIPSTQYTQILPMYSAAAAAGMVFFEDKTVEGAISGISTANMRQAKYSFTTPANCHYIRISYNTNGLPDDFPYPIVARGDVSNYEPYDGQSVTIALGQTVYGGTVDVTTGTMTVDRAIKMFTSGFNKHGSVPDAYYRNNSFTDAGAGAAYCNQFKYTTSGFGNTAYTVGMFSIDTNYTRLTLKIAGYTSGTELDAYLAEHPLQVVYPLAEPFTVQLTPEQMSTLVGENNVWCDAGDVALEYPYYEETEGY